MTTFSVIIPALNEAANITTCVRAVRQCDPTVEVIVADGGSRDETPALARAAGARVVLAPRGRGHQLNAGAAVATGDVFVFLHADTRLPANAFALLRAMFADPQVHIAKFRLSFDDPNWMLALAARLMWFDSLLTSYGDQCMVIRRAFFTALGGFPDWPLFEDVELFRRARARTRVHVVPAQVVTSARRFRANGIIRQLLHDFWLWLQYLGGVSPYDIARQYR
ncbi:MAG: TIGR04283 family arsenosugar biosynthesis glycosyltransferase [Chloroflexus sp.]|uniref:TIGR04283 family arsenosugar biosynthesis glycosyltransferase n=1 Tax=Chloroflexus sp. TaxID=1904827 RepID=UPI003D0D4881